MLRKALALSERLEDVYKRQGKYLPPFMVDITEQVKAQPRGGVIVITGLEVSDEDGESGGSGFDEMCIRDRVYTSPRINPSPHRQP